MPRGAAGEKLTARCHCGAVTIRMARRPSVIAHCNCSLCRALGWRGVYFRSDQLAIEGELSSYVRTDVREPTLRLFRCVHCGTPTHWEPLSPPPHDRMGVNANLLAAGLIEDIEVMHVDGRSWPL